MTVGETLLKITDYPFTFSVTLLILRANGIQEIFSEQTAIFLLIAGFAGTALTILDPIGKIAKYYFLWIAKLTYLEPEKQSWFERNVAKRSTDIAIRLINLRKKIRKNNDEVIPEDFTKINWAYIRSAFHTRAIELEKDKIVSIYYFVITLCIAMFIIWYSSIFTDHYPDSFKNNILCNVDCAKLLTVISIWTVVLCISIVLLINGNSFFNKLLISATYLFAVGSKEVPHESTASIDQFIEIGDWQTAEYWRRQIQDDLRYKRGLRDLIIKSTEMVYEPLYKEFLRLEGVFQQIELRKFYFTLGFGAWDAIKEGLSHLSVTDSEFVKLADSFQKENHRYENMLDRSKPEATNIILKHLSSIYNENIISVVINVSIQTASGTIQLDNLVDSSIFGSQPNSLYANSVPVSLTITSRDQLNNGRSRIITTDELNRFLLEWDSIIDEVKSLEFVKQLEESYGKILQSKKILQDKCEEQNRLKYKVF